MSDGFYWNSQIMTTEKLVIFILLAAFSGTVTICALILKVPSLVGEDEWVDSYQIREGTTPRREYLNRFGRFLNTVLWSSAVLMFLTLLIGYLLGY